MYSSMFHKFEKYFESSISWRCESRFRISNAKIFKKSKK